MIVKSQTLDGATIEIDLDEIILLQDALALHAKHYPKVYAQAGYKDIGEELGFVFEAVKEINHRQDEKDSGGY